MQRDCKTSLFQHADHILVFFDLDPGSCFVNLIRPCKMGKDTFDLNPRQLRDLNDLICRFFRDLESDPSHPGIELNVNLCNLSHAAGNVADLFGALPVKYRRSDLMRDQ